MGNLFLALPKTFFLHHSYIYIHYLCSNRRKTNEKGVQVSKKQKISRKIHRNSESWMNNKMNFISIHFMNKLMWTPHRTLIAEAFKVVSFEYGCQCDGNENFSIKEIQCWCVYTQTTATRKIVFVWDDRSVCRMQVHWVQIFV